MPPTLFVLSSFRSGSNSVVSLIDGESIGALIEAWLTDPDLSNRSLRFGPVACGRMGTGGGGGLTATLRAGVGVVGGGTLVAICSNLERRLDTDF